MTETTITATRTIRNGVDTATMFAPPHAIKGRAVDRAQVRLRTGAEWDDLRSGGPSPTMTTRVAQSAKQAAAMM